MGCQQQYCSTYITKKKKKIKVDRQGAKVRCHYKELYSLVQFLDLSPFLPYELLAEEGQFPRRQDTAISQDVHMEMIFPR